MIRFTKHSGVYTLETMQQLPIGLAEAWDFFSAPGNLATITPTHMGFEITSEVPEKMYAGQLITYRLAPFQGIKTNWVTEITHTNEPNYFVDEQRFGPYRMWHHEHHFKSTELGIEMIDKVTYKIPYGQLGHLAHQIFVKKQLKRIFEFRARALKEMFGEANGMLRS